MSNIKGGRITFKIDGKSYDCLGDFKYGIGADKREAIVGTSGVIGYSTIAQVPFIEGDIVKGHLLSGIDLAQVDGSTITLDLADGTTFALYDAWCVNDKGMELETKQGKITLRFEGRKGLEIGA
jgi:hypothetical protein